MTLSFVFPIYTVLASHQAVGSAKYYIGMMVRQKPGLQQFTLWFKSNLLSSFRSLLDISWGKKTIYLICTQGQSQIYSKQCLVMNGNFICSSRNVYLCRHHVVRSHSLWSPLLLFWLWLLFVSLLRQIMLCNSSWSGTHFVAQLGFELKAILLP